MARQGRRAWVLAAMIVVVAAGVLLTMGRNPICTCGTIELWHGSVNSAGNSQHLTDWYTLSHIVHGFLFHAGLWLVARRWPVTTRMVIATLLEGAWEIAENSPAIIDRYRTATAAVGYTGDSVVNSVADIGAMLVGFALARRLPVRGSVAAVLAFELVALWAIRDNLTLNVWMLVAPSDAVRAWQAAGQ